MPQQEFQAQAVILASPALDAELGQRVEALGCRPRPVKDLEQALALLETAPGSLVVLDMDPPGGGDALALAQAIRRQSAGAPILFILKPDQRPLLEGAMELYPLGWAAKPIDPAEFNLALGLMLEAARRERTRLEAARGLDLGRGGLAEAQLLAGIGFWTFEAGAEKPSWSEGMFSIFGLDPSQGEPACAAHRALIHPEDWEGFDAAVANALGYGQGRRLVVRLVRPDGQIRRIVTTFRAQRDEKGVVRSLGGVALDITGLKELEDELRKGEQRLHLALAAAQAGIWEWDLATGDNFWSEELWALYNLEPYSQKPSYLAWRDSIAEEDRAGLEQAVNQAAAKGGEINIEWRVRAPEGEEETRWLMSRGQPLRGEGGRVERYLGVVVDITDRKKAEQELQRAHESQQAALALTRTLIDSLPLPVFIKDNQGRYQDCNPAFTQMTGVSAQELKGKTVHDLWPEEYARVYEEKDRELMAQGLRQEYEFKIKDRFCKNRDVIYSKDVFRGPDGEIAGIIGSYIDITERKQAEESLKETSARLSGVLENSPLLISELDLSGRYLMANRAVCEFYQKADAREIVGRSVQEFIPPGAANLFMERIECVRQARAPLAVDDRLDSPEGERVFNTTLFPLFDAEGRISSVAGIAHDITERKNAEAALRASERRFRSFVENASDIIYSLDSDGAFAYVSPNWLELMGEPAEKAMGRSFELYVHPEDVERCREFLSRILAGRPGPRSVEYRARHADGSWRWQVSTGSIWREDEQEPPAYVGIAHDITERKTAEQELARRENLLQKVFDILPVGLWFADEHGTLLRGNPMGVRIWGAEPKVAMERYGVFKARRLPSGEEIAPDDWALAHTIREGRTITDELIEIDAFDGVTRTVLNYTAPVLDAQGGIEGAIVVNQDVTERRRAEEALRESERKYRQLFYHAPAGIYEMDLEQRRIVDVNDVACAYLGYTREEILNLEDPLAIFSEDSRRVLVSRLASLARGEDAPDQEELEVIAKDGRRFWALMNVSFTYEAGRVRGAHVVAHDITERRAMELALRQSEERWRSYVDNSPYGVFVADETGRYLEVNPEACRQTGYAQEELLQLSITDMLTPESLESGLADFERLGREGRLYTEHKHLTKAGEERWWSVAAVSLSENRFLGFTSDTTEKRRVEEEKARLEEQFRQAQKLESVGRLAGGVAHDLNNMLSPILGYGEMLMEDLSQEDTRRPAVAEIVQAGRRARTLVRQLLAFSRKQILEFKPLDLNQVLTRFEKLLRRTIREDVEIRFLRGSEIPLVRGDVGQLEQVIMNLAVNAQDAMGGGGTLTIETAVAELDEDYAALHDDVTPGEYVMLSVSDTGQGMDAQTQARLFEPFFTTKSKEQGTGLGLATVYGIVKQHGGNIWVYSEQGEGTTLKVYLPVAREADLPLDEPEMEPRELKGKETILLVEDNEQVRELSWTILRRHGYHVVAAASGPRAIEDMAAYQGRIDLLLTDVVMPQMSGRELFDRLVVSRPGLKVIYMSGYTDNVIAHRGVIDEGVNFIQKPFSVRGLAAKVRQVLDG